MQSEPTNPVKLSIIIPVYNAEKYLRKCLNSVVKQTLKDIEIICVNDGSKDNSLDILKEYSLKDPRIIVLDQKNQGQGAARNLAIRQAKGDFLGFVDSDDWIDLNYFETLYNAAIKYNTDIACAGYKKCRRFSKTIKKSFKGFKVYTDINSIVKVDQIPYDNYIWNKIFKREAWLNTEIVFPEGRFFEDTAVLIKIMYKIQNIVTVPNVYYYYRVNPNSTVSNPSAKHKKDLDWAVNELLTFARENNIEPDTSRDFYKRVYFKLFGITILKGYYYKNKTVYKLFKVILVFTKIEVFSP